jgi:hypothetical protein
MRARQAHPRKAPVKREQYRQLASEHSLQTSLLEYLTLYAPHAYWFAIPNAGKRSWSTAKRMKAEGLTAGVADLCIMLTSGRVLWLELKRGKEKQTPAQIVFQSVCENLGHAYYVARSFDEAISILRQWRILKGEPK